MKNAKWNKNRLIAGLCVCVISGAVLVGCTSQNIGEEMQAKGKQVLKVGFEGTTVPCSWTQRDNANGAVPVVGSNEYLCGFEVEYMKQLCEAAGYDMEAHKIDWDGLMLGVSSGKIDCAAAMIAPTEERRKTMDFTDTYYNADTVIVTKKDSPYASGTKLEDFSGARMTSMLNTLWYSQLDQIPGVQKESAMENVPVMLVAVKSGTVDGILLDEPTARGSVAANPELAIAPVIKGEGGFIIDESDTSVAVAVTKGKDEVTIALNKAINEIDADTLNQLIEDACAHAPSSN